MNTILILPVIGFFIIVTTNDIKIPEPSYEHLFVLRKYFGHSQFRPMQWRIIRSILENKEDNILIMATGKGKSLCYQYPAVYREGLSIVISPLISLMQDQVLALKASNISACFLGSAQRQKNQSLNEVYSGVSRVLYVTPEWCTSESGQNILNDIIKFREVTLLAVDEAHCVSHWGHDFRTSYRKLSFLKNLLTNVPILALTATATPLVKDDICATLDLRNPAITVTSFNRPNLYLAVSSKINSKNAEQIYLNLRPAMEKTELGYRFPGPTIIYCATKNRTKEVADVLNEKNIKSGIYHAGLSLRERNSVHERFLRDELEVVVATIAFGMGIDKPNVRRVIHYGLPKDMESYYQEVGRAGRDGLPAKCYVFHSYEDTILNEIIISQSSSPKFQEHKKLMMKHIKNFCETKSCRRRFLLSYFGESLPNRLEEPQPNCCDNCDKLLNGRNKSALKYKPKSGIDLTEEIKLLLRVFDYFGGRFGLGKPIKFLRGAKDGKFLHYQQENAMYGAGKHHSEAAWKALAKLCIAEGLLQERESNSFRSRKNFNSDNPFFGSTIEISPEGREFIMSDHRDGLPFELPEHTEKLFKTKKKAV